jgi:hypothetical protein
MPEPNPFSALLTPAPPVVVTKSAEPRPSAPVQSNPALSEPQQRWQADRAAVAAADPWQQDPSRVAMVKNADGTVTAQPRAPGDGGDPADPAKPGAPAAVADGGKLKIGDIELTESEIKGLMERKGLEDSRRATMPASAADYTLPTDMALPPGIEWAWKTDDPVLGPLIGQAKEWAQCNGIGQDGFSKMMGLFAASQIQDAQLFNRAAAAEVQKLGATGSVRVDAVRQFLNGHLGSDLAKALASTMVTAKQVQGFERLMQKFVSQGGGSFNGGNREPDSIPGKVSDAEYNSMSYAQKKAYTESFEARRR